MRMMQSEANWIAVNEHRVKILGLADDLNILSESLEGALDLTMALLRAAAKVGLQFNIEKTQFWSFSTKSYSMTTGIQ